jgi:hypothetical protein
MFKRKGLVPAEPGRGSFFYVRVRNAQAITIGIFVFAGLFFGFKLPRFSQPRSFHCAVFIIGIPKLYRNPDSYRDAYSICSVPITIGAGQLYNCTK